MLVSVVAVGSLDFYSMPMTPDVLCFLSNTAYMDKGVDLVIIDKDMYIEKCMVLLNDEEIYH